jgi:transcriptional regulator with XRE-family HTH domain
MAGRKRSELSGTGAQAELARRLRAARDGSGLTLRQLAAKSGYSQAALSSAESGRRTPSWEVTAAFAQSCGSDPATWRQLWEMASRPAPTGGHAGSGAGTHPTARGTTEPPSRALPADDSTPAPAPSLHPSNTPQDTRTDRPRPADTAPQTADSARPRPRAGLAAAVTAALLAGAGVGAWALADRAHPAQTVAATTSTPALANPARDGTDPYDDRCKADEKQLDWQPVSYPDGRPFGTLILMYSLVCQAAWGYLNGPNTTAWTTHIIARRVPGGAAAPSQFNGNAPYGSWGNVLSTRTGCVYIEAYITDNHGEGPHARTACIQLPPLPTRG